MIITTSTRCIFYLLELHKTPYRLYIYSFYLINDCSFSHYKHLLIRKLCEWTVLCHVNIVRTTYYLQPLVVSGRNGGNYIVWWKGWASGWSEMCLRHQVAADAGRRRRRGAGCARAGAAARGCRVPRRPAARHPRPASRRSRSRARRRRRPRTTTPSPSSSTSALSLRPPTHSRQLLQYNCISICWNLFLLSLCLNSWRLNFQLRIIL